MWSWLFRKETPIVQPPMVFFTPTKDFFSEEYRSQYTAGLMYQASAANTKLQGSVGEWEKQGLVRRVHNDRHSAKARLQGKGTV